MNPMTMPMERFVVAYTGLAVLLLAASVVMWLMSGRGARPAKLTELTADPYRIAFLRAGTEETLHVALFNLVDRGILAYDGSSVRTLRADAIESLRRPLDRLLVKVCRGPASVKNLARNPAVRGAIEIYENELGARGLVSAGSEWTWRRAFGWASFLLLIGLIGARIVHEVSVRALPDINGMMAPAVFVTALVVLATHRRRTYIGGQMLDALRWTLARLKARAPTAKRGGENNEALLIAATFSLYALPASVFPFIEEMFPKPKGVGGADGASSDGGGDSGSCGGGCGGCGGCGS